MFTNGQRVERHEVEHWVAEAHPNHAYFTAIVTETEETAKQRIRVTVQIAGPHGDPIAGAVYYSLRDMVGMPQIDASWAA